jgi:nifR3 family TIM-barrel protein
VSLVGPVAPVSVGSVTLPVPVILAPMAGVTNSAFRQVCREAAEEGADAASAERSTAQGAATEHVTTEQAATPEPVIRPAGIFVCEMVTARGVASRIDKTFAMMRPDPGDPLPSVQLHGVDPATIATAVRIATGELGVAHVDLNFGCPVPKVTRKGGGGALPWKLDRYAAIVAAAVAAAEPCAVPVTVKLRLGIDDAHETFRDAGRIAAEAGCAAVTLHARTVLQAYGGRAGWSRIAALAADLPIPVFGNGDIWEAGDAIRMLETTGCAGVEIGRGCLGRPWLFTDLACALVTGRAGPATLPDLGQVVAVARRHAALLVEHFGDERHAMADLRKHMAWYFKGFHLGGDLRHRLGMVSSLAELDRLTGELDPAEPFPVRELAHPRGRQGSPRSKVTLPHGWLDSRVLDGDLEDDPDAPSGG